MLGGAIDTVYLGAVPVKGRTEKMKLFSVASLVDEERLAEIRSRHSQDEVSLHMGRAARDERELRAEQVS